MYYIRKYTDCWAVHDDITGASRKLSAAEVEKVRIEFDVLKDDKVRTVCIDRIRSIEGIKERYEAHASPSPGA